MFFSRITLEDKLGVEYEPYIFAALNSAKIMLAFGTDYEYFNAVWVKNEWSRYLKLMAQDKSKHLIPCNKGIDAYDMPKEFMKLQAQDLGKVGAVQDLLRGIEKIIPRKQVQPAAAPQPAAAVSPVETYLKRAEMALEDGEWDRASTFCEQVLNIDPENAQAYLIKLLAEMQVTKAEQLGNVMSFTADNMNYKKLLRFASPALKQTLSQCLAKVEAAARKASEADFKKNATIVDGVLTKYRGKLEDVYIPYGITAIGDDAFGDCGELSTGTIPDSVESIGTCAFTWCVALTTVTIGNGVKSIGDNAFSECKSLITITIPAATTQIDGNPFNSCASLTYIAVAEENENFCSMGGHLVNRKTKTLITGCGDAPIPDGVTCIGEFAFLRSKMLTRGLFRRAWGAFAMAPSRSAATSRRYRSRPPSRSLRAIHSPAAAD